MQSVDNWALKLKRHSDTGMTWSMFDRIKKVMPQSDICMQAETFAACKSK